MLHLSIVRFSLVNILKTLQARMLYHKPEALPSSHLDSAPRLPVRYLSMLPAFYNWIAKVAPKEEYQAGIRVWGCKV